MAATRAEGQPGFSALPDQPLIGIPDDTEGQGVRYFTSEEEADQASNQTTLHKALAAIGSWSDLDWEETLDELDRIRHESKPTPPIEEL